MAQDFDYFTNFKAGPPEGADVGYAAQDKMGDFGMKLCPMGEASPRTAAPVNTDRNMLDTGANSEAVFGISTFVEQYGDLLP